MKPIKRQARHSSAYLQPIAKSNNPGKIKGSVKAAGMRYENAFVYLFTKSNFQPLCVCRPDSEGNYSFLDLPRDLVAFIAAFDRKKQFNAVIQDNVVPK